MSKNQITLCSSYHNILTQQFEIFHPQTLLIVTFQLDFPSIDNRTISLFLINIRLELLLVKMFIKYIVLLKPRNYEFKVCALRRAGRNIIVSQNYQQFRGPM